MHSIAADAAFFFTIELSTGGIAESLSAIRITSPGSGVGICHLYLKA